MERQEAAREAAKETQRRLKQRGSGKKNYTVSLSQKNYQVFKKVCGPRLASDTLDLLIKCYLEALGKI